jgi:hypothetical protein
MNKMMRRRNPFPLLIVSTPIAATRLAWETLRRGENGMPFSDDLRVAALSNMPGDPFLLSVSVARVLPFEFLERKPAAGRNAGTLRR